MLHNIFNDEVSAQAALDADFEDYKTANNYSASNGYWIVTTSLDVVAQRVIDGKWHYEKCNDSLSTHTEEEYDPSWEIAPEPSSFFMKTNLDSSSTFDPALNISATWDYGDGNSDTGSSVSHTYTDEAASHDVTIDDIDITAVTVISATGDGITDIDVTGFTGLITMWVYYNPLPNLDASNLPSLIDLRVGLNNTLETADLSGSDNIQYLNLRTGLLTELDISNLTAMHHLEVYDNLLTSIDISSHPLLTYVRVQGNVLSSTNLAKIISDLKGFGKLNGTFEFDGTPHISALDDFNGLVTDGWSITGNTPA